MEEEQGIILRENAKAELMAIKDIESGVKYLNKVKSIETWVKAEKKDAELQNIVAEQKLRTQRILGGLLSEADLRGRNGGDVKSSTARELDSLEDFGVTKKQSSAFQAIASIPEKKFEQFIEEKKEAVNNAVAELTTTGAVRLAKSLTEKKRAVNTMQDVNHRLRVEKELKQLASDLKKKYSKDEIEILVKFLTK